MREFFRLVICYALGRTNPRALVAPAVGRPPAQGNMFDQDLP